MVSTSLAPRQRGLASAATARGPRGRCAAPPRPCRPAPRGFAVPSAPPASRAPRPAAAAAAGSACPWDDAACASATRTLLVAVDNSLDSQHAFRWVLEHLAPPRAGGATRVHLLHCIPAAPGERLTTAPDGRVAAVDSSAAADGFEAGRFAAAAAAVDAWAADAWAAAGPPPGVTYDVDVWRGSQFLAGDKAEVAAEVCRRAGELRAAAVVVASHSLGSLSERLLGSVAADAARRCDRPVIVLHAPAGGGAGGGGATATWLARLLGRRAAAEAAADPRVVSSADFSDYDEGGGGANLIGQTAEGAVTVDDAPPARAEGAGRQEPAGAGPPPAAPPGGGRTLLVAVDGSDASERAVAWAATCLARPGDALRVLHVVPLLPTPVAGLDSGGAIGAVYVAAAAPDAAAAAAVAAAEARLAPRLRAAGVPYAIEAVLEPTEGSVAGIGAAVCRAAERADAAAVVLGSAARGGVVEFMLGSVAQYVVHHCTRPVAVLH